MSHYTMVVEIDIYLPYLVCIDIYLGNLQELELSFSNREMNGKLAGVWNGSVFITYISQDSVLNKSLLNLAFTLCTDRIPIYKSSSITLWPILLMILRPIFIFS